MEFSLPAGHLVVVGLAAHPDDLEIGCGGLLLGLAARGDVSGHFLTLTGTAVREAEARTAAARFLPGATSTFAGLSDGRLPGEWESVKAALHAHAGRTPAPDLVLAPRVDDAHQDHRILAELAVTVWRDSLVLRYEIPKWDGDLGRTTFYVPVEDEVARRKVELLGMCYPSQTSHDWWDEEVFLGLLRLRGAECHRRYAEGYVVDKSIVAF